jgi:hypothetical protein
VNRLGLGPLEWVAVTGCLLILAVLIPGLR